jgi:hypothetical protein
MKNKNIDAVQVWKDFEDRLAPRLNFSSLHSIREYICCCFASEALIVV